MPAKPLKQMSPEERRAYERERKRRQRAAALPRSRRAVRRPARLPNVADALDAQPDAALVRLPTWVSLSTRQRLDNASHATGQTVQAIVEKALDLGLFEIEMKHNKGIPFPDPPPGKGARARSQRAREARAKCDATPLV